MAQHRAPWIAHSIRRAADEILGAADVALEGLTSETPSRAVHDFRVALKRWRALLRLLSGQLGEAVALRREAGLLSRTFNRSRDAQAALDALADMAGTKDATAPSVWGRNRAAIVTRVEGLRRTSEMAALDAKTLQRLRAGLARASASLSRWPLKRMAFEDLATALARSYRRARRRLPRNWETASAEDIHAFRKAVVTFRYQLELFEPLWPKVSRTLTGEMQKLRVRLGKSNDLVALGALIRPRQPLARWRSGLALPIESRRQFHLIRARRLARRLFAETPRSFRKRIEAKVEAES